MIQVMIEDVDRQMENILYGRIPNKVLPFLWSNQINAKAGIIRFKKEVNSE